MEYDHTGDQYAAYFAKHGLTPTSVRDCPIICRWIWPSNLEVRVRNRDGGIIFHVYVNNHGVITACQRTLDSAILHELHDNKWINVTYDNWFHPCGPIHIGQQYYMDRATICPDKSFMYKIHVYTPTRTEGYCANELPEWPPAVPQ